ncbi:MAG: 2-phosphosulfolactate phosphatase [Bacillota bacterium]
MLVRTCLTADGLPQEITGKEAVVVIDVLRASSTIITAFNSGCREVIPVASPEEALEMKKNLPKECLLGGEREALIIPGFDLGNSPQEYRPEIVRGKTLVMTTTNGTKALILSKGAASSLIGGFLNASAVTGKLASAPEVLLACAGTKGRFSLEDFAAAGAIAHRLSIRGAKLADLTMAACGLYLAYREKLEALLSASEHGQRIIRLGWQADISYCGQEDLCPVVPVFQENSLRIVI